MREREREREKTQLVYISTRQTIGSRLCGIETIYFACYFFKKKGCDLNVVWKNSLPSKKNLTTSKTEFGQLQTPRKTRICVLWKKFLILNI